MAPKTGDVRTRSPRPGNGRDCPPPSMTNESKTPAPPKRPRPSFFRRPAFLLALAVAFLVVAIASANSFLNKRDVQDRLAQFLHEKAGIKADFDAITLEFFTGELSGKGITLDFERNKLLLSLQQFSVRFTPLALFIGEISVTAVTADEIYLDTSETVKSAAKTEHGKLPDFLTHLSLRRAEINRFYWNQGTKGTLFVDKVRIASRFGSLFYQSPTTMRIRRLKYLGAKTHVFADKIVQNGFFIFDLSQPRIVDESRIASRIRAEGLLVSFQKRRKPWLTNPGWDEDLTATIAKNYGGTLPENRSYLHVPRFDVNFEKNRGSVVLNSLGLRLGDADLKASGNYNHGTGILAFKLATEKPAPFSKLPLGQAQIRQAFTDFTLALNVKGNAKSLDENRLKVELDAGFTGNKISETDGDLSISLKGEIVNATLTADPVVARMGGGNLTARGTLGLKTGETDLDFTCDDLSALTVVRLFSTTNIPSLTDCRGRLSGKVTAPKLQLSMTSADAGYEFLHFGPAAGELALEDGNLKLDVRSTSSEVGTSRLTMRIAEVFDGFKQALDLESRYENVDLRKALNAKSLDGRISGTFTLQRRDTSNAGKGDFKVTGFRFFDREVGDLTAKVDLKNKHLVVAPIGIEVAEPAIAVSTAKGLVFDFDQYGYAFAGELMPELALKGQFKKADKEHLDLSLDVKNMPLKIFSSLMPFEPQKSALTGKFDLKYAVYEPIRSQMRGEVKELLLQMPEGDVSLARPSRLDYDNRAFKFTRFEIKEGEGNVILDGALGMENNSALKVSGKVDFDVISDFNPFIAESDHPTSLDLTLKGDIFKPQLFGKVVLDGNAIVFRNLPADLEDIEGEVRFNGNRIDFPGLKFNYDDAPMVVDGYVATDYEKITAADLTLTGAEVPIHLANGLNMLADMDVRLKGSGTLGVAGKFNVVEGQYNRDFGLVNFILQPRGSGLEDDEDARPFAVLPGDTRLDLAVRNTGDFTIKNNLAELEMQADLKLEGTLSRPTLMGQVDLVNGEVNAFGIDFEDAAGYIQFRRNDGLNPEINIVAKKEIQEFEIKARVEGKLDNLKLKLDSTPSLDRREILSILFYGQTPDQLVGERRHQFTQTAAISQLASVLSKPINKVSGLDVVEVSSRQESSNSTIQRLSVGKSVSERFNLLFTTDLGVEDPERALELEYQFFDNFYFIAAKDLGEGERYRFDLNFRIQGY